MKLSGQSSHPNFTPGETVVPTKQGMGGPQSLSEHGGEQECLKSLQEMNPPSLVIQIKE